MKTNNLLVSSGEWSSTKFTCDKKPQETKDDVLVVFRFTCKLETLNPKTSLPFSEDASFSDVSSDEDQDDEDVQEAKQSDTYSLFREDILKGARDIKWTLTETTPERHSRIIPEHRYLTRGGVYEDDMEIEDDETGTTCTRDRVVPSGYYAGLYRDSTKQGSTFQISLKRKGKRAFFIRYFRVDVFNTQPLPHNWDVCKKQIVT